MGVVEVNLELSRRHFLEDRCIGDIYIDGHWECFTLEDQDRHLEDYLNKPDIKVPGKTAIPRGRYQVIIDHSTRFKQNMPHLLNVPLFEGIRIHPGNTPENTSGCILLGQEIDFKANIILRSRLAYELFLDKLKFGLSQGQVWITIS